jgi:hypothetical protein
MSKKLNIEWAYNTLSICTIGDEKQDLHTLMEIIEDLQDPDDMSPLTFYTHAPIPDMLVETLGQDDEYTLQQCVKVTGCKTMHEYTIKHWGCVTDASDVNFVQPDNSNAYYEFKTRSKPPMAWLKEISEQYPDMMFELTSTNEFELWEEFEAVFVNGKEVVMHYSKRQP